MVIESKKSHELDPPQAMNEERFRTITINAYGWIDRVHHNLNEHIQPHEKIVSILSSNDEKFLYVVVDSQIQTP